MARYRTMKEWKKLTGDDALTEPERLLIECCQKGEFCLLGDGTRPEGPDRARTIRADLLRYLILGGCAECKLDEAGMRLIGAYIPDPLTLDFATAKGQTVLFRCRFATEISALQTRFELLSLSGSALPGLNAQGVIVTGAVRLSDGFHASGKVSLSSAKIGGQLSCSGGRFENEDGHALNAEGVKVAGDTFLRNGFHASGKVSLSGAKIGGQLSCIKGRFENEGGDALIAGRMQVAAEFFWQDVTVTSGTVDLAAAHVGDLVDDADSWPPPGRLYLDGFTYDRISAAPTDAARRLDWLAKGTRWEGEFFPQPYTQLAKVLREMGHDRAARQVRMKQEELVRLHLRRTARITPNGDVDVALKSLWADARNFIRFWWDFLLRWSVGYGHAPGRSLLILTVLFLMAVFLANRTWNEGSFAPNSGVILISSGWTDLAEAKAVANPAYVWSAKGAPGQDWESFNRYAYGFDVVVPILTLGQTDAWAPSKERGRWGYHLWWARWVLSSLGWLFTALGAAAITGIIRRE